MLHRRARRGTGPAGRRFRTPWAAVAWAPHSRRSEMFARELGGDLHCIHYLRFQSPRYAPFKYPLQAVKTLAVLFRERPAAVHVQDPPFLCPWIVSLYCLLTGAVFVIEYHSAAFGSAWKLGRPVQRWVARRAAANIVTNEHWAEVVGAWGGRTLVMYDAFLDLPAGEPYEVGDGFTVAFLCTFAADEPAQAVVDAARLLPDVRFYVTGDTRRAREVVASAPDNVTFTGFLDPNGAYLGLLRAADVAIVLTTRDHTLQLAGCEAMAVGTPLVTSHWAYLRELFGDGAVYVEHDADSIARGVEEAREHLALLRREVEQVRAHRRAEWRERMDALRAFAAPGARRRRTGAAAPRDEAAERAGANRQEVPA